MTTTAAIQPNGNSILPPGFYDLLKISNAALDFEIFCQRPGTIIDFDESTATATVQIQQLWTLPNGTPQTFPPIAGVPCFTLQGGGGFIQMPIAKEDNCLLFFADRNIDAWRTQGSAQVPNNQRAHDISDCFAFVGVNPMSALLSAYVANQLTIAYSGATIALAGGKVTIKNQAQSLKTILDTLLTTIEGATSSTGDTGIATIAAAASAAKISVDALLF